MSGPGTATSPAMKVPYGPYYPPSHSPTGFGAGPGPAISPAEPTPTAVGELVPSPVSGRDDADDRTVRAARVTFTGPGAGAGAGAGSAAEAAASAGDYSEDIRRCRAADAANAAAYADMVSSGYFRGVAALEAAGRSAPRSCKWDLLSRRVTSENLETAKLSGHVRNPQSFDLVLHADPDSLNEPTISMVLRVSMRNEVACIVYYHKADDCMYAMYLCFRHLFPVNDSLARRIDAQTDPSRKHVSISDYIIGKDLSFYSDRPISDKKIELASLKSKLIDNIDQLKRQVPEGKIYSSWLNEYELDAMRKNRALLRLKAGDVSTVLYDIKYNQSNEHIFTVGEVVCHRRFSDGAYIFSRINKFIQGIVELRSSPGDSEDINYLPTTELLHIPQPACKPISNLLSGINIRRILPNTWSYPSRLHTIPTERLWAQKQLARLRSIDQDTTEGRTHIPKAVAPWMRAVADRKAAEARAQLEAQLDLEFG